MNSLLTGCSQRSISTSQGAATSGLPPPSVKVPWTTIGSVGRECSGASRFGLRSLQYPESRIFRDPESWRLRNSNLKASKAINPGMFGIFCFRDLEIRVSKFLKLSIPGLSNFVYWRLLVRIWGPPTSGPCTGRSSNYKIFRTKPGRREKCIFVPFIFIK